MKEKLKILIANDDGIRSEGIAKLARAAASFGTVWVAAPEHQCSGMSVRLTISEKSQMAVYRYDFPVPVEAAWSVDGTPADCVKVALNALLPFRPDIVLSGINDGLNAGLDVALPRNHRRSDRGGHARRSRHCIFHARRQILRRYRSLPLLRSWRASGEAARPGRNLERQLPHLSALRLPRHSVRAFPGKAVVLRKLL